jgi:hypothetical protein
MKYLLFLALSTSLSICYCAESKDNIYKLQINEPIRIDGLTVELLHLNAYQPMTGTSSVLQVEYKGRKDIILIGLATCEGVEEPYHWQGYTFRLIDPETATKEKLQVEIILKELTEVKDIFIQNNLNAAFEKMKDLMSVQEMEFGNRQMNLLKTENELINASCHIGRNHNYREWEQKFVEHIDIIGQTNGTGYHFSFMKDKDGRILIKSSPTEESKYGINYSLNWLLGLGSD